MCSAVWLTLLMLFQNRFSTRALAFHIQLDSFVNGIKSMSEAHGVKKGLDDLERINDLDFTHLSSQDKWLLDPVNWS